MAPKRWVAVDAIPVTANGKVDRNALKEKAASSAPTEAAATAPEGTRDPNVHLIRLMAAEVLRVPVGSLSTSARLDSQGLSSLSAVRLAKRLSGEVGRTLKSTVLFTYPTIELVAQHISSFHQPRSELRGTKGGDRAAHRTRDVETALCTHPDILSAAVSLMATESGGLELHAELVGAREVAPSHALPSSDLDYKLTQPGLPRVPEGARCVPLPPLAMGPEAVRKLFARKSYRRFNRGQTVGTNQLSHLLCKGTALQPRFERGEGGAQPSLGDICDARCRSTWYPIV